MKTTTGHATGPVTVDVPIKDVDAQSLRLKLNEAETEPVLASSTLSTTTAAGLQLSLRMDVIGASHVVTLQRSDGVNAIEFREELSCSPQGRGVEIADGLDYGTQSSGWDYHVSVLSRTVDREEFLSTARRLERQVGAGWLVARFPGEGEGHITALSATIDTSLQAPEVSWCTWHLYAEQSVVVRSYSRAQLSNQPSGEEHV